MKMPTNFWWHSAQIWTVYRSKIPKYGIDPSIPQKGTKLLPYH